MFDDEIGDRKINNDAYRQATYAVSVEIHVVTVENKYARIVKQANRLRIYGIDLRQKNL